MAQRVHLVISTRSEAINSGPDGAVHRSIRGPANARPGRRRLIVRRSDRAGGPTTKGHLGIGAPRSHITFLIGHAIAIKKLKQIKNASIASFPACDQGRRALFAVGDDLPGVLDDSSIGYGSLEKIDDDNILLDNTQTLYFFLVASCSPTR